MLFSEPDARQTDLYINNKRMEEEEEDDTYTHTMLTCLCFIYTL